MGKKALVVLCLIGCLVLSGCVYNKILVLKIRGDQVKAPIGSYTPIEGKNVNGVAVWQSFWTDEKGKTPPALSDILTKDEADNTGSLDIKK